MTKSVSEHLANWVVSLTPEKLDSGMERAALDTVVDILGLCVAARDNDYTRSAIAACDEAGRATVIAQDRQLAPVAAALINGTAAHGEDFDNTFEGCPVHSGAVIVPATLAIAEQRGLDGARTLLAIAAGIEIMCRLGLVANKSVHQAGFHPTAVLGTFAATISAAIVTQLSRPAVVNGLGIAGSLASGIIEYLADGSSTKRLHAGWAAQSGLRAAALGAAGFTGPVTVFEGVHGFFSAFAPSIKPDFSLLLDDLGRRWVGSRLAFKPYACGTMVQPYIDCALALRKQGIPAERIAEITCAAGEGTVHRLWEPLSLKQQPPTAYAAKFSTPYCMAVAYLEGDAGLAQFTEAKIKDGEVLKLAAKIRFEIDPKNEYPRNYTGHLRARLADGTVVELNQPHLRGGGREPLSREELDMKFRRNVAFGGWSAERAEALLAFGRNLGRQPTMAALGNVAA
ncbi:MmgE/PrpD family protein [Dongia sp.]|uniref:MmgE/PrpD family protein n=1 Tax=Dongia sp. TaxID=1977262 RepID=UPI0035ADFB82